MAYRVLLIEDEIRMQEVLADYFNAKGEVLVGALDGEEALDILAEQDFDLILLDIMMPKLDGWAVCREVRKSSKVPIIFLTAKCDEDDQLYGYDLGADDYITKPFSLPVLYAKAIALIKRAKGMNNQKQLTVGGICLDCAKHEAFINGEQVHLTPKGYEILRFLMENKGQVISREQLLAKVWGYDFDGDDRVVDTQIKKLRKNLGNQGRLIKTVIKAGYKLEGS